MKNPKHLPALIFAGFLTAGAILLFALMPQRTPLAQPGQERRPIVAATIFPLYDIVRHIAGNEADVRIILPPGAEPHAYEPPPSLIADLSGARAIYAIGYGLDDWVDPVVNAAGARKIVVDDGIDLLASETSISAEPDEAEEHGPVDPHYWLSLPNAARIATNVAADLKVRLPRSGPAIDSNLATYLEDLTAADAKVRGLLADIANPNIIVFHEAWYYFAKEYGLRVVGNFEPTAGREPTPRYLAALKDAVVRSGARSIYTEPLFSDELVRSFAADNDLNLAAIDDIGGVPGRDSLIDLVIYDAQTIKNNQ